MTLGERCVAWCLSRAAEESRPSLQTLALWFKHSERNGKSLGLDAIVRNGTRLNHCAAAQCAAALECAYEDDLIPHRPRAGAKELMVDAIDAGAWHTIEEIRAGEWVPRPGDLVIYDRYDPSNPRSQRWHGHVDRVVRVVDGLRLETIGANEVQGHWRQEIEDLGADDCRALGVVAYPVEDEDDGPKRLLSEADAERIRSDVALLTDTMVQEFWEGHRE